MNYVFQVIHCSLNLWFAFCSYTLPTTKQFYTLFPVVQIMRIVESAQYPKVAFEALLDQIEVLQMEKRRLLFGDNADLEQGEEGNEEGMPL